MYKYLDEEILSGFSSYKYSSVDTSPISNYISHPFWNWLVEFYPRWIAPNVLTFSGFSFIVFHFLCISYYDVDFTASSDSLSGPSIPPWVWLVSSISIFMAHTLDGTDGKQARRINSCGPLGELFDHGLDSWATFFITTSIFSLFGRADYSVNVYWMLFILISIHITFFISHWEKYNTGTLFLPWSYDLSQIVMTALYFITFLYSYKMWKLNLLFGLNLAEVASIFLYVTPFLVTLPMTCLNLFKCYKSGTIKTNSLFECVQPLSPIVLFYLLMFWWIFTSPSNIFEKEPRLFMFYIGVVFSNITCRLIISGMSNTKCPAFNYLLVPLLAITVYVQLISNVETEKNLLICLTFVSLAAHLHYGVCVVVQLADYLKVKIFSVKLDDHSD